MAKSKHYQACEKLLADIIQAHDKSIKGGQKEILVSNLNGKIDGFRLLLNDALLSNTQEVGELLAHLISTFSNEKLSQPFEIMLGVLLEKLDELDKEKQEIIFSTKINRLNALKLAANQSEVALDLLLPRIANLERGGQLRIITGMNNHQDRASTAYGRKSIEALNTKINALQLAEKLLTVRDEEDCDDSWNIIAYAKHNEDPELIRLILLNLATALAADPNFLSDPTSDDRANELIHFYILSTLTPSILDTEELREDQPTLKKMLIAKGSENQTVLCTAVLKGDHSRVLALFKLIKYLDDKDQKDILKGLPDDAKLQLRKMNAEQINPLIAQHLGGRLVEVKVLWPRPEEQLAQTSISTLSIN